VSAILRIPLTRDPLEKIPDLSPHTDAVSVSIEDSTFCKRYIAAYITQVDVGPSPLWLRRNLEAIGQRSVNNVVDATNFVMFNLGQPLHAFDAGKLKEKNGTFAIAVRSARKGEKMLALDNKEYALSESMSVIADANSDTAIGIAGVKGGEPSGITESTRDIIIESANFAGVPVRKTASALKLRTDASARYEQAISPRLAAYGIASVVELIQRIAGGELAGFTDVYPDEEQDREIMVTLKKINSVLGTTLTVAEVSNAFSRLGFSYKEEGGEFRVMPPFERLDLHRAEDLVEEVARLVGYEKIQGEMLPPPARPIEINPQFFAAERAREDLISQGYSEVYTSVFSDRGERAVLNKEGGVRPFMRTSLIPGLEDALKKNLPNKDLLGLKEVRLFEIGVIWRDGKEVVMLGRIGEKEKASETPLEEVEGTAYEVLPISETRQFAPYSKYPYIVRDIAMWVPKDTDAEDIRTLLYKEGGHLVQKVSLFDRFEKNERLSLAFRLVFQSFEKTLTENEANEAMEKLSELLKKKGFEIR
jgi:phenylalanyl-tRNA synthetase beta chain